MGTNGPVRWGILGTGGITKKLLAGARRSTDVTVVAVGSRTAERAAAYAAEHNIGRAHGSYDDLLEDPLVEAVYISLPNSLHHPWTMRALAAGKHVLCEKPYTRHPEEVEAAFDAADRAGLILSEAFMWRHHPQASRILELLPELGGLQTIRGTFSFVLEDADDIRLAPELDGGALMDVGCYCVSGARLLAGDEPELVFGLSTPGPSGVDIRFNGLLRFPSGVIASFTSGPAGSAVLTDAWQSMPATLIRNGVETAFEPADPYQLEIEDVSAAIRGRSSARLGRADALGQARTIAALYRSADTGAPVRL